VQPQRHLSLVLALIAPTLCVLAASALAQPQPQQRPARPAPTRPPAIVTEPLPPIPAPRPTPPEPVQRRVALPELGLPAGLAFDTAGREMSVKLPRELAIGGARLSFTVEVAAPYGGRQAVEVTVNGRLLGALAFTEASTRLAFEAAVPPEDLARAPEALRIGLRLVEAAGGGARATLLPSSYIAIPLVTPPGLGALQSMLPPRILVLVAPGAVAAADAAMALRVALALADTGRQVRIGTGTPAEPLNVGGQRVWETGTVVIGAPVAGAEI